MAKDDSNTGWGLSETLLDGPIKENLTKLDEELDRILKARELLYTLYCYAADVDHETITLATETVFTLTVMLETGVGGVQHHLSKIFKPEPQPQAQEGGEA
jgi:hypothetical protein